MQAAHAASLAFRGRGLTIPGRGGRAPTEMQVAARESIACSVVGHLGPGVGRSIDETIAALGFAAPIRPVGLRPCEAGNDHLHPYRRGCRGPREFRCGKDPVGLCRNGAVGALDHHTSPHISATHFNRRRDEMPHGDGEPLSIGTSATRETGSDIDALIDTVFEHADGDLNLIDAHAAHFAEANDTHTMLNEEAGRTHCRLCRHPAPLTNHRPRGAFGTRADCPLQPLGPGSSAADHV